MDTRPNIFLLLDYKEYYGIEKAINDAKELIKDIPSITLINYISGFNVNLYLNEYDGKMQACLVDSLLSKMGDEDINKWKDVIQKQNEHSPIMIWNYSNLLFYELIFSVFNHKGSRDLTSIEAKIFFDAYLIINLHINKKTEANSENLKKASQDGSFKNEMLANFIYQRDYKSTVDFTNQLVRGVMFFRYLESHNKYRTLVNEYYEELKVKDYVEVFRSILSLFGGIEIEKAIRKQLIDLSKPIIENFVNTNYINSLCINEVVSDYKPDISFGILREKCLFKVSSNQYFVLDINFLFDKLYKSQVFSFNSYLKSKGGSEDFLSLKAKEFMEDIYLSRVIINGFPTYTKFFGGECVNSKNEELCDAYLRDKNKVCLIEFKDVLLNADAKNSGNRDLLEKHLNTKLLSNQKGKPKGVTQLINGVKDFVSTPITFDKMPPTASIDVYPILIYTDSSFGFDGLNEIYTKSFDYEFGNFKRSTFNVNPITFINLNFFELFEDCLSSEQLNLFTLLDEYFYHIKKEGRESTPFEVFTNFYLAENNITRTVTQSYRSIFNQIFPTT